jgi:hypothetical protein
VTKEIGSLFLQDIGIGMNGNFFISTLGYEYNIICGILLLKKIQYLNVIKVIKSGFIMNPMKMPIRFIFLGMVNLQVKIK